MGLGVDNSKSYALGDVIFQNDGIFIFRATEESVGAPCYFHRIMLASGAGDLERHSASAAMKRYGAIKMPRTPRLVDGWIGDDHLVVVEYKTDARPFSLRDNNPLQDFQSTRAGEVMESALGLLTSLHRLNIVHGRVKPEIFGLGVAGKVYLLDTGIDEALRKAVNQKGADMFMLSTNLQALDLARWAIAMLDLANKARLMPNAPEENWDQYHLKEADQKLRELIPMEPVRDFFSKCLRGFTSETPPFESAIEAQKHWKNQRFWSYFK